MDDTCLAELQAANTAKDDELLDTPEFKAVKGAAIERNNQRKAAAGELKPPAAQQGGAC